MTLFDGTLFDGSVGWGTLALLFVCLAIALSFEFVNGFHDTANAVATVIYTKSLKPWVAVIWSGSMNFLGVLLGGAAVAFSIVHLLPVELLINIGKKAGLLMVLSLLVTAIAWNFGTWYFGLPASSSHALIGSILGVGLASSIFSGQGFGSGVNWTKAQEVGLSLLISPLVGFLLAGGLLVLSKALLKKHELFKEPQGDQPPPLWIRAILFLTCTGVSFAHGSNDGQKGVGLIMLILIGILPTHYAINTNFNATEADRTLDGIQRIQTILARSGIDEARGTAEDLRKISAVLSDRAGLKSLSPQLRIDLRDRILSADDRLGEFEKSQAAFLSPADREALDQARARMRGVVDFVVIWVLVAVAFALGIGTTVGWKRVVITIGEKIGKTHLSYAQGASAELVAMTTIAAGDMFGLPVSTTHVLSSGVAGTMAANLSGLQMRTIRNIAMAWILTLPVTMLIAGGLFVSTARGALR
ncbi:MAG: inorganic phosphate transporter, partial [Chloracidobacterium sp.]|nr:inorganic phosphate transporter [Chloracidobacterium sp.]